MKENNPGIGSNTFELVFKKEFFIQAPYKIITDDLVIYTNEAGIAMISKAIEEEVESTGVWVQMQEEETIKRIHRNFMNNVLLGYPVENTEVPIEEIIKNWEEEYKQSKL